MKRISSRMAIDLSFTLKGKIAVSGKSARTDAALPGEVALFSSSLLRTSEITGTGRDADCWLFWKTKVNFI